jgi:hypothetical protein
MREKCKRSSWESPKEIDHSEDQGVDGRMGSEWILVRLAGPMAGCFVCGDEPSGSCATE